MYDTPEAQATELKRLAAAAGFEKLTKAENLLLEKAPKGDEAICGPNNKDEDKDNDPKEADSWGPGRQIRAGLLGWLCMDQDARKRIHWKGVQVYGADITDGLDLSFVNFPFLLALQHCRIREDIHLNGAEVSELALQGSLVKAIEADRLIVKNYVFLGEKFHADGRVWFLGAQIGGDLDCHDGTFAKQGDEALVADRVNVKGSVFLRDGFTASGEVGLVGAQIGSDLDCSGGTFTNKGLYALAADRINVKGGVFLRNGFIANGEVRLLGAQIGNGLDCHGGSFTNGTGMALNAEAADIKGSALFDRKETPFTATGKINLVRAQIGCILFCDGGNFHGATLDLTDASAASLLDSSTTIWPQQDHLVLDGFTYGRISSTDPVELDKRLDWLALQPAPPFPSRPYIQLAKVLRESADQDGSLKVLEMMEERRRRSLEHGFLKPLERLESWGLELSIGYGYYPARAIWEIVGMSALGWIIYRRSYLAGTMAPTDKDAYTEFRSKSMVLPQYPAFSPLVYSVENSLPLVKLGQADKWQPDPEPQDRSLQNVPAPTFAKRGTWAWAPNKLHGLWQVLMRRLVTAWGGLPAWLRNSCAWPLAKVERALIRLGLTPETDPRRPAYSFGRFGTSPSIVTWFLWIQILLGWLLATLFVAGVTGIVHKD